jgi:hypothetical protein
MVCQSRPSGEFFNKSVNSWVLHKKALELQSQFHSLSNRRNNALSQRGRIEGLNLKEGLGKLSQVGAPFGQVFTTPTDVSHFIAQLKQYRETLNNFAKFKLTNPKREGIVLATV